MSKVIMVNGCFYSCSSEPQSVSALWKETAQTSIRSFSFLVAESPLTSIKQSQTLTTHNANRHCRVDFFSFEGQPLSKQLYNSYQHGIIDAKKRLLFITLCKIFIFIEIVLNESL